MTESDVGMVAHNGMCGLWRLSDMLPIYELVIKSGSLAELSDLVRDYVPWFKHTEDVSSDAEALKNVVKFRVTN
jgi:hypothetical protein